MNIQRYKFPVIIAASLHGALFLHSSHPPVIAPDPAVEASPAKPPESIIEFSEPIPETSAEASPAGSENPLKELPEVPTKLTDKVVFALPMVDTHRSEKYDNSLIDHRGAPVGLGIGPVDVAGVSSIHVGKLDRLPRATAQMSPDYPSSMKQQNVSGSVVVEFSSTRKVGLSGRTSLAARGGNSPNQRCAPYATGGLSLASETGDSSNSE